MNINDLFVILKSDEPSLLIKESEDEIFKLIPKLEVCKGFNQNNPWHPYDVYNHILLVVDNVPNDLITRLAALFHDVGKPANYQEDENGIGHFWGHWITSREIFESFASKYNLDDKITEEVANLIYYHDLRFGKFKGERLDEIISHFDNDNIKRLYDLKRADLLAQSSEYYYLLNDLVKEKEVVLKRCLKTDD